ncbi:hypothetical protein [Cellulomonas sp. KRMCY2]|uniref:hypothetical protein n=1 Tax=Cellulomonas sp. KRMCY2 TaxID=1304865 RepID=UPI00045E9466|nr:hypothetical protein [Cellulomonas sp. KRMCY2]
MAARPHDAEEPGADPSQDDEAQWLDIVARLSGMDPIPPDALPSDADDPEPAPPAASPDRTPGPDARTVRPALSAADPRSWSVDPAVEEAEEAEDHFEPPDPGPVLGGDPLLTMAWGAVVGVPILIMVIAVVWRDVPSLVLEVAGVAFLAGVGLLLWRMPHDRDDDQGTGAVV